MVYPLFTENFFFGLLKSYVRIKDCKQYSMCGVPMRHKCLKKPQNSLGPQCEHTWSRRNGFVPVVRKRILDIMLPVRTSLLRKSFLVESLVYFSSLRPRFASLFQLSLLYIFRAYILALRVYFSRVSCLFFEPISSLREQAYLFEAFLAI